MRMVETVFGLGEGCTGWGSDGVVMVAYTQKVSLMSLFP